MKNRYQNLKEATGDSSSGSFRMPLQPKQKEWKKTSLSPFDINISNGDDKPNIDTVSKKARFAERPKVAFFKNGKEQVSEWIEITDDLIVEEVSEDKKLESLIKKVLKEDLAVWFGTKKKPKGSKQPKGPWVNICKKVDGKHPPCGRSEATDKAYPKCRAAGVAGKMSDSQKKAACSQKRRAEKTHSKSGTGNKPKMVSYKPRKK